jgi:hypothetical protein
MWKCHVFYESRPHSVIVTLGGQSLQDTRGSSDYCPTKQCRKVISHMTKFILFMIQSEGEQKDTTTTTALAQDLSIQAEVDQQDCRRAQRYSYFTYGGASTLPSQAKL